MFTFEKMFRTCAECGKDFAVNDSKHYQWKKTMDKHLRYFCSYTCYKIAVEKNKRNDGNLPKTEKQ